MITSGSAALQLEKSRQAMRRDGFLGTVSVYMVGLWSEPNYERIRADTRRRSNEPGKLGHELAARFHTDIWAHVHVRREHADVARRDFPTLHECEHAARR